MFPGRPAVATDPEASTASRVQTWPIRRPATRPLRPQAGTARRPDGSSHRRGRNDDDATAPASRPRQSPPTRWRRQPIRRKTSGVGCSDRRARGIARRRKSAPNRRLPQWPAGHIRGTRCRPQSDCGSRICRPAPGPDPASSTPALRCKVYTIVKRLQVVHGQIRSWTKFIAGRRAPSSASADPGDAPCLQPAPVFFAVETGRRRSDQRCSTTNSDGTNSTAMQVEASMPLKTVSPMERRAAALKLPLRTRGEARRG